MQLSKIFCCVLVFIMMSSNLYSQKDPLQSVEENAIKAFEIQTLNQYKNTFFGLDAGHAFFITTKNTANCTDSDCANNVFLGYKTGYSNTLGHGNVFTGGQAGYSNIAGIHNVFIGLKAGYSNTTGDYNVFTGLEAGYSNTTGNGNVFTGPRAGYFNKAGHNNIILGNLAGFNNTNGFGNVYVGSQAGYNNSGGEYNVFIGTSAGYSSVLEEGQHQNSGKSNVFTGAKAGVNNQTGNYNLFSGFQAGHQNAGGSKNVLLGVNAGFTNEYGDNNVIIGYNAMYSLIEGDYNVMIGDSAGYSNQYNGYNNVFIGSKAGYSETGSNKLYIENSKDNISPLLYGDFANDSLFVSGTTLDSINRPTIGPGTFYVHGTSASDALLLGYNKLVPGTVATINGAVHISHTDSIPEDFDVTAYGKEYLLWVEEGIVTDDVAIAGPEYWRDCVFEKDYELMELTNLEHFIQQNMHLPNVPSEAEILKNGYTVHAMNATFMEKIEELVLYTIEQQKEIERQKEEIEYLRKMERRLVDLEKKLARLTE